MRIISLISIIIIGVQISYGQDSFKKFDDVDSFSATVQDTFTNYQDLASVLTKDYEDDLLKMRSIYYWIINNIEYDDWLAKKGKAYYFQFEVDWVLRFNSSTCMGYSSLFEQMCSYAGIRSAAIGGYIKGDTQTEDIYGYPTHQWNVVQINDAWYHIDLTWDASNLKESKDSLDFLITIYDLIKTRIPSNPMWQFSNNPLSLAEYANEDLIAEHDFSGGNFNFKEKINKYFELSGIDQELFETEQEYLYNPITSMYYGEKLIEKGDSLAYGSDPFETDHESTRRDIQRRNYYVESLKYINPSIPLYREHDEVEYYRPKQAKKMIKNVNGKIKLIDNLYKYHISYTE